MRFTHLPTPIDAVRWGGDLDAVLQFIAEDPAVEVADDVASVLWVTERREAVSVFPVPLGCWLVRHRNQRYGCTTDQALRELYRPDLAIA